MEISFQCIAVSFPLRHCVLNVEVMRSLVFLSEFESNEKKRLRITLPTALSESSSTSVKGFFLFFFLS